MHGHYKLRFNTAHWQLSRSEFPHDFVHNLRARTDGGHALSTTTVIMIGVCCAVGGVVFGLVMWRLIRACRSTSAPLPPVQPLARYRERDLLQSDKSNRASTWNHHLTLQGQSRDSSCLVASEDGSDVSLFLSRHPSFQIEENNTLRASLVDSVLPIPNPAFRASWGTRSSSPLGKTTGLAASDDYLSTPPHSASSTSSLHDPQRAHTDAGSVVSSSSQSVRQAEPSPHPRLSKPRPISSASSHTSLLARNTIRGSPHSVYSNVQIVLPTPLALQSRPGRTGNSIALSREDLSSRNSYVDRWIPVGRSSEDVNSAHSMLPTRSSSYEVLDRPPSKGSFRTASRSRSPFQRNRPNPPSSYPGTPEFLPPPHSDTLDYTSPPSQPPNQRHLPVSNLTNVVSSESPTNSSPGKPNELTK